MQEVTRDKVLDVCVYCDDCQETGFCLCASVDACLRDMGMNANVRGYTQTLDRVSAGIPLAPALSINGRLVAMGSDLSRETIGLLLATTLRQRDSNQADDSLN